MKKTQKRLGNKGFSLVELIVVIAIMAVLVGVLAPTLIRNVEKSRESKDAQNVDSIKNAIEVTLQDENVYNGVVGVKSDLVTLTSTGATVEPTASFDTKLKETLDVTKTHLTSKKYKSQTIIFQVDGQGHVSVTGLPTEEKASK